MVSANLKGCMTDLTKDAVMKVEWKRTDKELPPKDGYYWVYDGENINMTRYEQERYGENIYCSKTITELRQSYSIVEPYKSNGFIGMELANITHWAECTYPQKPEITNELTK